MRNIPSLHLIWHSNIGTPINEIPKQKGEKKKIKPSKGGCIKEMRERKEKNGGSNGESEKNPISKAVDALNMPMFGTEIISFIFSFSSGETCGGI